MTIARQSQTTLTIFDPETIASLGSAANESSQRQAAKKYKSRKAQNTKAAHLGDLRSFATFLAELQLRATGQKLEDVNPGEQQSLDQSIDRQAQTLMDEPAAWVPVTWGLVDQYQNWSLSQGYTIATTNRRISTIRQYLSIAHKAGHVSTEEMVKARGVTLLSREEGINIDANRPVTRRSTKRAKGTVLLAEQLDALMMRPDTPQGIRDRLLIALLADLGLRASELALITKANIDAGSSYLTFYRPKVKKSQTLELSTRIRSALADYLFYLPEEGPILRASLKSGALVDNPMNQLTISKRVTALAHATIDDTSLSQPARILKRISAHDLRHTWATQTAREPGMTLLRLQEAGGWSSLAMPRRYIEEAKIANEGMVR